jgi:predicted dehydrogenase
MKKIKFAVLGCGHIGKRHAELILSHPNAELIALIDPVDQNTLRFSSDPIPYFKDLDTFLNAGHDVDVVNICTPNGLHAKHAITCLNHKKHVVIEKPIALCTTDALAILEAADINGMYAFPVVQNRYSSTIKWLKNIVEQGRLGKIFMIQLNCFWNRDERYYKKGSWHGTLELDGGPLFTQFSHFIDVLNWVFGDITNINSKFSNFNHQKNTEFEDSGIISFDLVSGGVGSINYSTSIYQSNFESSITVIAENGTVKIGGQYMNHIEYCHAQGTKQPTLAKASPMNDYGAYTGSASNHQFLIDDVIKVMNGIARPNVSLKDGVKVVNIVERIYSGRNEQTFTFELFKDLTCS